MCLGSFAATAPPDSSLCVFDNGSCDEVIEYLRKLQYERLVTTLITSTRNVGKVNAWNALFALPLGLFVTFFDSDVLFLPGWYEDSRAILETFPHAATVTAQPIPGTLERHCDATINGAVSDSSVHVSEGPDLIPSHYVDSHRLGLGETPEVYANRIVNRRDVRLTRAGVEAYVSSSHFQFLGRSDVLKSYFPLPSTRVLGDDFLFDERVDASKRWRLSTSDYLVHHMGNKVPNLAEELPWLDSPVSERLIEGRHESPRFSKVSHSRLVDRLLGARPVRRLLKFLNTRTYRWLYPNS